MPISEHHKVGVGTVSTTLDHANEARQSKVQELDKTWENTNTFKMESLLAMMTLAFTHHPLYNYINSFTIIIVIILIIKTIIILIIKITVIIIISIIIIDSLRC